MSKMTTYHMKQYLSQTCKDSVTWENLMSVQHSFGPNETQCQNIYKLELQHSFKAKALKTALEEATEHLFQHRISKDLLIRT